MNTVAIIIAAAVIAGTGIVVGIVLGIFGQKFHVAAAAVILVATAWPRQSPREKPLSMPVR